jgi:uncharacterized protein (DUF1330 family)
MKSWIKYSLLIGVAVGIGYALGTHQSTVSAAKEPYAYMVVSTKLLTDRSELAAYSEKAGPLARSAGIEVLAGRPDRTVTVLEGEWPYEEGILIERFTSMKALKDFWYSDGYQEAKKLRDGIVKANFIVAVNGVDPSE